LSATLATAWFFDAVPSWGFPFDPCILATVAAAITVVFLWVARWLGPRALASERLWLSGFLAGMPLVYVSRYLWKVERVQGLWLGIELMGLLLFATLAWLGWKRSPGLLAAGIALHGVAWDCWHLRSSYVPHWYALGCLLIDLTLGAYVAMRVSGYQEERRHRSVVAGHRG
jgi:hypothetical protein